MNALTATSLHIHFGSLPGPRVKRAKRHDLLDVMTMARCAVLCGAGA